MAALHFFPITFPTIMKPETETQIMCYPGIIFLIAFSVLLTLPLPSSLYLSFLLGMVSISITKPDPHLLFFCSCFVPAPRPRPRPRPLLRFS